MNFFQTPCHATGPRLHVFQQEGGWHWGITIERSAGGGFKVIAYSEHTFPDEDKAQNDGDRALVNLSDLS